MSVICHFRFFITGALIVGPTMAVAQVRLDRADPTITSKRFLRPSPPFGPMS